jgi:hypothetical protein
MHILDNPEAELRPVSLDLENKIKHVSRLVVKYRFTPYYEDPFMEEKLTSVAKSELQLDQKTN